MLEAINIAIANWNSGILDTEDKIGHIIEHEKRAAEIKLQEKHKVIYVHDKTTNKNNAKRIY